MPDTDQDFAIDSQAGAEALDEDMLNDDLLAPAGADMRTFEELPDLLDVTAAAGDVDDDSWDAEEEDYAVPVVAADADEDDDEDEDEADDEDDIDDEVDVEDLEDDDLDDDAEDEDEDDEEDDLDGEDDDAEAALASADDPQPLGAEQQLLAQERDRPTVAGHCVGDEGPGAGAPSDPDDPDHPHARPATAPLKAGRAWDQLGHHARKAEDRQEALLDEAVEETFPASDPVSVKRIT